MSRSLAVTAAVALVVSALSAAVPGTASASITPSADAVPPPLAASATASLSGSVVYVHAHNVWIAEPDGSHARAVTKDGTATTPYAYPSQSDAGQIVASHGQSGLVLMNQQGKVVRRWAATNDYPSISPDGRTIAFSYLARVGVVDPQWTHVLRYIDSASTKSSGQDLSHSDLEDSVFASWASNSRTVITSYSTPTQIMYHDLSAATTSLWFNDCDSIYRPCPGSELLDNDNWMSTVDRTGTRFASVITLGGTTIGTTTATFLTFQQTSAATTGTPPAEPTLACTFTGVETIANPGLAQVSIQTPSWSPDGRALVASFRNAAGAWQVFRFDVGSDLADCGSYGGGPILTDAQQPRWSPAALQPATSTTTPPAVTRSATHTRLNASTHHVKRRHKVKLVAKVSGATKGKVRFTDGRHALKKVKISHHRAKLTVRLTKVGTHKLKATFLGDSTHRASTSKVVKVKVRR